ncbi:MAG: DUF1989 domain-containing protein, partial [Pseudomonadota bacterium]
MSRGRMLAGFPSASAGQTIALAPRAAHRFELQEGDLLRINGTAHPGQTCLLAFAPDGTRVDEAFGVGTPTPIPSVDFEGAELRAWIAAQAGDSGQAGRAVRLGPMDEPLVLRAPSPATVWLVHTQSASDLVEGNSRGAAQISHQPVSGKQPLPPYLGEVREEFTVPSGTAMAYELRAGETVQIIDVEGQQCSDFQAMRLRGLNQGLEHLIDSTATRSMVRRAYPTPGLMDKFFDPAMRPLLQVIQDTCGRHDTLGLACTARGYEERGFPGHVNCSDNISGALSLYGVTPRNAWPAINFFWNTWLDDHHNILTEEAFSRPGDYVAMTALDDLVCVSTACPDDIDPINGWNPTDVHVRIYTPKTRIQRAIAYRSKEDAPMQISRQSAFHPRLEPLTNHFAPARDLWAPVSFPSHGT